MFYWFKRGADGLRYEAREVSPSRYELRIIGPRGAEAVEIFDTADALFEREVALERELLVNGWTGPYRRNV